MSAPGRDDALPVGGDAGGPLTAQEALGMIGYRTEVISGATEGTVWVRIFNNAHADEQRGSLSEIEAMFGEFVAKIEAAAEAAVAARRADLVAAEKRLEQVREAARRSRRAAK